MTYSEHLPSMNELRRLVKSVSVYPASAQQFIDAAGQSGSKPDIISFLHIFHPDDVFEDGSDFISRCEGLELLIDQKRQSPNEILHSSDG